MKKTALTYLGIVVLVAALSSGCATGGKGASDDEIIAANTAACIAATEAQDVDGLLKYYSEDFSHYEFGDKAGLCAFLKDAKDMGYLEDIEIDLDSSETVIDGDEATVGPIYLSGSFGSTTLEFTLTKEAGDWKISGMDIEL